MTTSDTPAFPTHPPASSSRFRWFARLVCLLSLAAMFFSLFAWCRLKGWTHDEVENVHAGWLVYQNQIPYTDFFHHKPPFYWYFVSLYFHLFGEDLGVLLWARNWMVVTFIIAVGLTFLIARELFDEWTGWAAAGLLACNALAHYPATEPREQGWMLVLLLAGILVWLRAWRRSFRWHQALLAGLLLGGAYLHHPRAGAPIFALAVVTAYSCHFHTGWKIVWQRRGTLLLFAATCVALLSIPYLLYGWRFHYNLYRVSLNVAPEYRFHPWGLMKNLYFSTYAVMPLILTGTGAGLFMLWKRNKRSFSVVATFVFFLFANLQTISNPCAFVQAFYSLVPFVALLCSISIYWLGRRLPSNHIAAAVACLLLGGFLSTINPSYWTAPDDFSISRHRAATLLKVIPRRALPVRHGISSHPPARRQLLLVRDEPHHGLLPASRSCLQT